MALLDQHLDQPDTNFSSPDLLVAAVNAYPTRFSDETHELVSTILANEFQVTTVTP